MKQIILHIAAKNANTATTTTAVSVGSPAGIAIGMAAGYASGMEIESTGKSTG